MMVESQNISRKRARQPFHVMLKPRGAVCNLGCAYCFYLSKEQLYPQGTLRMDQAVLESFVRQYIEAQPLPEVTFAWQGGEPTLMGLDFYRQAVELQRKYLRPGMRLFNSFQTNGILLDEEWCRFFRENEFLVGLSLDGPAELHDAYRVDKSGKGSHARVMEAARLLKTHGVEFNILACVNALTSAHPLEVYRFLRDRSGTPFIQFIPIVEHQNGQVSQRSVSGEAFGRFLVTIFREWLKRDVGKVFVQAFDTALAAWLGQPIPLCVQAPVCGNALAMEHNGDLYSCDHFVSPPYRLGNILEIPLASLVESPAQVQFGQDKKRQLPRQCRECAVLFACNGGCPKDRIGMPDAQEPGLNRLCPGYLHFFTSIDPAMRRMAELFKTGRAPAEIMRESKFTARHRHRRRP